MKENYQYRAYNPDTKQMIYSFEAPPEPSQLGNFFMAISLAPNSIIMKGTGIPDKNGVNIYAGDIIKSPCEDLAYCLCEWNDDLACFQINGYGYDMHYGEGSQEVYDSHISLIEDNSIVFGGDQDIEVLGNIHQHSNLIPSPNPHN